MNLATFLFLAQAASPTPAAGSTQPQGYVFILQLVFIGVIFYFLLIRPQQKRQKEHQKLVESVKTGDKIVTSGGMHGIVANVKERTVMVKVADNVKIELDRAAITSVERAEATTEETK